MDIITHYLLPTYTALKLYNQKYGFIAVQALVEFT